MFLASSLRETTQDFSKCWRKAAGDVRRMNRTIGKMFNAYRFREVSLGTHHALGQILGNTSLLESSVTPTLVPIVLLPVCQ